MIKRQTDRQEPIARAIIDNEMSDEMAAIKTLTINEVSERINVAPRTIRKVLRANFDKTPGRGARYAINESDLPALIEMVNSHTAKSAVVLSFDKGE